MPLRLKGQNDNKGQHILILIIEECLSTILRGIKSILYSVLVCNNYRKVTNIYENIMNVRSKNY